jgi:uncharacterized protein YukE
MRKTPNIFAGISSVLIVIGSIYAFLNRQELYDWIALRNYEPSARIVQLADSTTMQPETRRVFYVNRPDIQDKQAFRNSCDAREQSIVLGCFINTRGIFLLDVTDPRLNGIVEVTSAHEVLHAMYDRLDAKERAEVDRMTTEFFKTLNNERIKKAIENYRAKDPSVVPNELHSILGSEVRNLSPELEAYYARYFSNRSAIVDLSEKYEQQFVDLENQVAEYDKQLAKMKSEIEENQQLLPGQESDIENEKARLDRLLQAGRVEEYNAGVAGFNQQVNRYNALIAQTKSTIEQYNAVVQKRNEIATAEQELVQAIDANALPQKQ